MLPGSPKSMAEKKQKKLKTRGSPMALLGSGTIESQRSLGVQVYALMEAMHPSWLPWEVHSNLFRANLLCQTDNRTHSSLR